ncbi:Homologous-pairing protein 2 homolog, partial [Geodia barretti]
FPFFISPSPLLLLFFPTHPLSLSSFLSLFSPPFLCVELSALNSSLTAEQASNQLRELEKETGEMNKQLTKLKSGDRVSPEECKKVTKAHTEAVRHWRKRKRMTTDIVNAILEGYPKSKKQLFEEVGIETDEDYGVSVPS